MKSVKIFAVILMVSAAMFSSKEIKAQARVNIYLDMRELPTNYPQRVWDGTAILGLVQTGTTVSQEIAVPVGNNYSFSMVLPVMSYTGEIRVRIELGMGGVIVWLGRARETGTWNYFLYHAPIIVNTWERN